MQSHERTVGKHAASLHGLLVEPMQPESVALLAPGRPPLLYADLAEQVRAIGSALSTAGIDGGKRVAVAMPNGPELGVAVLGIAAYTACAPLDPKLSEREFGEALARLRIDCLILPAAAGVAARRAAASAGVPCVEASFDDALPAGQFSLPSGLAARAPLPASGERIALLLQTSGTTASPKVVPLTHAQLIRSAANIAASLSVVPSDRCLNVMPLFHVHGLVGALLASLHAGASVVCTSELDAAAFASWLRQFAPTWYTAVPTMHRAIARALGGNANGLGTSLRFVRSASSALPPSVAASLEATFGVPVIEAYGMTEAAHQIATNPLPPLPRVPGSVGLAAGIDVAIMDDAGNLLPARSTGQIVIRGGSVIAGYDAAPEVDADAFFGGWFLTGDQGWLDEHGYLHLTGRLKELVNRGGEKIGPLEVEAVLLQHDAVVECAVVGVPHPTLGEDLMAAVVGEPGATLDPDAIRDWMFGRIADAKIPSGLVVVEALPKGSTGKLHRAKIAESLKSRVAATFVAPNGELEVYLAETIASLLGLTRVGANDNFFLLGGDSLRGAQLLGRVQERFGAVATLATLFKMPTARQLAKAISGAASEASSARPPLLPRVQTFRDDKAKPAAGPG